MKVCLTRNVTVPPEAFSKPTGGLAQEYPEGAELDLKAEFIARAMEPFGLCEPPAARQARLDAAERIAKAQAEADEELAKATKKADAKEAKAEAKAEAEAKGGGQGGGAGSS